MDIFHYVCNIPHLSILSALSRLSMRALLMSLYWRREWCAIYFPLIYSGNKRAAGRVSLTKQGHHRDDGILLVFLNIGYNSIVLDLNLERVIIDIEGRIS
jgi:hypothetical protein